MPPKIRRILFYSFVVIFFVSAGLVLFFESGYRYHFAKRKIEKTGQLVVLAQPRDAKLFFNGQELRTGWTPGLSIGNQREIRLEYVLSGMYDIVLAKENYYDWSTRVTIEQGRTTLISDALLIKKPQPAISFQLSDIKDFVQVGKQAFIAWSEKNIFAINEAQKSSVKLGEFKNAIESVVQSPSKKKLLVRAGADIAIISENENQVVQVVPHAKYIWGPRDTLYAHDGSTIYRYRTKPEILGKSTEAIQDLFVSEDETVYLLLSQSIATFKDGVVSVRAKLEKPVQFVHNTTVRDPFIETRAGHILFRESGKVMWQLPFSPEMSIRQIDENAILAWNDFEVWMYSISSTGYERQLLTRQSAPIRTAALIEKTPYLFIATDTNAYLLNTSKSEQEIYEIAYSKQRSDFHVASDEYAVHYISGGGKKESAIMKVEFIEP
jgi:hypothetical protein